MLVSFDKFTSIYKRQPLQKLGRGRWAHPWPLALDTENYSPPLDEAGNAAAVPVCLTLSTGGLGGPVYSILVRPPYYQLFSWLLSLKGDNHIFVHNLHYDLFFMHKYIYSAIEQMFSIKNRAVRVEAPPLVLHDTWKLCTSSLASWYTALGLGELNKTGWDYSRARDGSTPLTSREVAYAVGDTEALLACVHAFVAANKEVDILRGSTEHKHYYIRNTQSSYTRQYLDNNASRLGIQHKTWSLSSGAHAAIRASQGGGLVGVNNRLANRWITGGLVHVIDVCSMHPSRLLTQRFPLRGAPRKGAVDEASGAAWWSTVAVKGLRLKPDAPWASIMQSKCTFYADYKIDINGKVVCCDALLLATDWIDWQVIRLLYHVKDYAIQPGYVEALELLPARERLLYLQLYNNKQNACSKAEKTIAKFALNSGCYGVACQNPIIEDSQLDALTLLPTENNNENALFLKKYNVNNTKGWRWRTHKTHRWLPYGAGCAVAAYSRLALVEMALAAQSAGVLVLAGDTDSLFLQGDCASVDALLHATNNTNPLRAANEWTTSGVTVGDWELEATGAAFCAKRPKCYRLVDDTGRVVKHAHSGVTEADALSISNDDYTKSWTIKGAKKISRPVYVDGRPDGVSILNSDYCYTDSSRRMTAEDMLQYSYTSMLESEDA